MIERWTNDVDPKSLINPNHIKKYGEPEQEYIKGYKKLLPKDAASQVGAHLYRADYEVAESVRNPIIPVERVSCVIRNYHTETAHRDVMGVKFGLEFMFTSSAGHPEFGYSPIHKVGLIDTLDDEGFGFCALVNDYSLEDESIYGGGLDSRGEESFVLQTLHNVLQLKRTGKLTLVQPHPQPEPGPRLPLRLVD